MQAGRLVMQAPSHLVPITVRRSCHHSYCSTVHVTPHVRMCSSLHPYRLVIASRNMLCHLHLTDQRCIRGTDQLLFKSTKPTTDGTPCVQPVTGSWPMPCSTSRQRLGPPDLFVHSTSLPCPLYTLAKWATLHAWPDVSTWDTYCWSHSAHLTWCVHFRHLLLESVCTPDMFTLDTAGVCLHTWPDVSTLDTYCWSLSVHLTWYVHFRHLLLESVCTPDLMCPL